MREAMYGWVEKWLCDRGDGRPINEPSIPVLDVASLRCYPEGSPRPKAVVTIPEFAREEGLERLAALAKAPDHKERWTADAERMRGAIRDQILGGFPPRVPLAIESKQGQGKIAFQVTTESGIRAMGEAVVAAGGRAGTALFVSAHSTSAKPDDPAAQEQNRQWNAAGFATLHVTDARITPREVSNVAPVAGVDDHNPAEWASGWAGRCSASGRGISFAGSTFSMNSR